MELVSQSRSGRQRFYRLTATPQASIGLGQYEQFWTRNLGRVLGGTPTNQTVTLEVSLPALPRASLASPH